MVLMITNENFLTRDCSSALPQRLLHQKYGRVLASGFYPPRRRYAGWQHRIFTIASKNAAAFFPTVLLLMQNEPCGLQSRIGM